MTYRSPLRIEWDRVKDRLALQALQTDDAGAIARALVKFCPVLVDFLEDELKRGTRPTMTLEAATVAICNMTHKTIAATVAPASQREALHIFHSLIERDVAPKFGVGRFPSARLFIPGQQL